MEQQKEITDILKSLVRKAEVKKIRCFLSQSKSGIPRVSVEIPGGRISIFYYSTTKSYKMLWRAYGEQGIRSTYSEEETLKEVSSVVHQFITKAKERKTNKLSNNNQ